MAATDRIPNSYKVSEGKTRVDLVMIYGVEEEVLGHFTGAHSLI